jgi:hypothetical protein
MSLKKLFMIGVVLAISGAAYAATDQNASVGYPVPVKDSRQISATGLTSSDTVYDESDCIGGQLTFTDACKTTSGRYVQQVVVYKVQYFNTGTVTVDATLLLFSESFTSPGDNAAWAMGDGEFSEKYITRIDLAQTAQVESGGDTYAEAVEVNINCPCTGDRNLYGQLVKNKVGPIGIGGDTRSASADAVVRLWTHQLEK